MTDLEQATAKTADLYRRMRSDALEMLDALKSGEMNCIGPDGSNSTATLIKMQEDFLAETRDRIASLPSP